MTRNEASGESIEGVDPVALSAVVTRSPAAVVMLLAGWEHHHLTLEPILASIRDTTGGVAFVKLDLSDPTSWELARALGVLNVPSVVLYRAGEPVETLVGVRDEDELRSRIRAHFEPA